MSFAKYVSINPSNPLIHKHHVYFKDATNCATLSSNSIDLVVTSPPYWSIIDYGNNHQIGYNDSLDVYFDKLLSIFGSCITALKSNGKLVINIGDQFMPADDSPRNVYEIIPLEKLLIAKMVDRYGSTIRYLGSINWEKVSRSDTSGGGSVMGSVRYPKSGYFFTNREYIIVFAKLGDEPPVDKTLRKYSGIPSKDRQLFFRDSWRFGGERQTVHPAMFPEELPSRIIRMYSYVGDVVLDPFLGTGTTILAASKLARQSVGFEIGFTSLNDQPWQDVIKQKIVQPNILYNFPDYDQTPPQIRRLFVQNKYFFYA